MHNVVQMANVAIIAGCGPVPDFMGLGDKGRIQCRNFGKQKKKLTFYGIALCCNRQCGRFERLSKAPTSSHASLSKSIGACLELPRKKN